MPFTLPRTLLVAVAAALAALALTTLLAPERAEARAGMEIAIQDDAVLRNQRYFDRDRAFDLMKPLNVSRVRFNAIWHVLNQQTNETARPANPTYDFTRLDSAIAATRARGLRVLLTITGPAPAWANAERVAGSPVKPNAKEFGRFVRLVVQRYRGQVDAYSIWNEPNHVAWLAPAAQQGKLYRALYEQGYRAVRKADPKAKVLFGETAPFARSSRSGTAPLRFMRQAACATSAYERARRTCKPLVADGVAHHPYDFERAPTKAIPGADNVTIATLDRLTGALDRLAAAKLLRGPKGRPLDLWLTEYGYFARKETGREKVFPAATRAKYLRQAFEIAQRHPRVVSMLQYLIVEYPLGLFRFNTAIVSENGTPMPTYQALAAWSRKAAIRGQVRAAP